MELKKAKYINEEQFKAFISQWTGKIIPSTLEKGRENFGELLQNLELMENDPPRLLVPSTLFFLTDEDGKILGAIDIRHFLNDGLLKYGGHIGYGVAPKERGHNYAALMIDLSRPFLKQLGLEKVLICCDEENIPSAKTILACGGVLENNVDLTHDGKVIVGQRYWVQV